MTERPTFILRLQAAPGIDPIRNLRALLKIAVRRLGFRCIEAREEESAAPPVRDAAP